MKVDRLRKLRTRAKKSQKELADFLGITRQGYGNYENGITEPDHNTLSKLADFFETTTDYLIGRTNDPRPLQSSLSFYNGPEGWTEDELKAADDFINEIREARQRALDKAKKEK